jgi:hypothetical protein
MMILCQKRRRRRRRLVERNLAMAQLHLMVTMPVMRNLFILMRKKTVARRTCFMLSL